MGHCHSSTQLGSDRGVWAAYRRAGGTAAQRSGRIGNLAAQLTRQLLVAAIRAYQVLLAPSLGGACKFHPSCSRYALEAVERWGIRRGGWLAMRRLARCRPFSRGGWDPVPDVAEEAR